MTERGTLRENEPHPAAESARQWLFRYVSRQGPNELFLLQESFASNAIEGNRLSEVCGETLRRFLAGEPVSDRYAVGLIWTIREMEEMSEIAGGQE
jgi:hypothetical protein